LTFKHAGNVKYLVLFIVFDDVKITVPDKKWEGLFFHVNFFLFNAHHKNLTFLSRKEKSKREFSLESRIVSTRFNGLRKKSVDLPGGLTHAYGSAAVNYSRLDGRPGLS